MFNGHQGALAKNPRFESKDPPPDSLTRESRDVAEGAGEDRLHEMAKPKKASLQQDVVFLSGDGMEPDISSQLLMQAGDVERNPGPTRVDVKPKCKQCKGTIRSRAGSLSSFVCWVCNCHYHKKCATKKVFDQIQQACHECMEVVNSQPHEKHDQHVQHEQHEQYPNDQVQDGAQKACAATHTYPEDLGEDGVNEHDGHDEHEQHDATSEEVRPTHCAICKYNIRKGYDYLRCSECKAGIHKGMACSDES